MELKQQIKDLQLDLETRGDAFEQLLEDHKEIRKVFVDFLAIDNAFCQ